ncbi:MAG: hypothetical protein R3F49_01855 [Planctomycetota bacterium]
MRAVFLAGAWSASFIGDEPAYLRLARGWAQHGAYTGQWPPLFPGFLALCFDAFGDQGVRAARVGLTLLSVLVGALLMALAANVSGPRAARLTGWLYALYLPLVPYAHLALSETLYLTVLLPALILLARAGREREGAPRWVLPLAGALLGLSALVREASLAVILCVVPWVAFATRATPRAGLSAAAMTLSMAVLVIAPWSARNLFAYAKVVPLSTTSGTNAFLGLNAVYTNFDLVRLADANPSHVVGSGLRARLLSDPPPAWGRAIEGNVAARDAVNLRSGLRFAVEHPGYVARTRVLRLADFFTPLSYAVKFQRLGAYGAPLDHTVLRVGVAWVAVLQVLALLVLGLLAFAAARLRPGSRTLMVTVAAALTAPALLVAMSRFRAPLEALLLIAAAALIAGPREVAPVRRLGSALVGLAALSFLWYLSLPPTVASLEAIP